MQDNYSSPNKKQFYCDKTFWNNRFEKSKGYFDWYVGWKELKPYIKDFLNEDSRILMVGCGNSQMSEHMYKDNYTQIVNIDISDVVVEKMKILYKETCEKMKFIEMDATNLTFEANSFDFTFDKGTLDALMCAQSMDHPVKLIQEMYRVTKINGYIAIVTYGRPDERMKVFNDALIEAKFQFSFNKISLSLMSNLINILRNNTGVSSVSQAIQDKELLVKSIVEASISKLKVEKEELISKGEEQSERVEHINKKMLQMKMLKLFYEKKYEKETKTSPSIVTENKEELLADELDNLNITEQNKSSDARRTHCYLYLFKKLE